jgi:hypothetical protein
MMTLAVGILYGIGFAVTLIGLTMWVVILGGLHTDYPLLKFIGGVVFWPVTWARAAWGMYKASKDGP